MRGLQSRLWLGLVSAILVWCAAAAAQTSTRELASGVTYQQEISVGSTPLVVNILKVNLKEPGVKVRYGQAHNGFDYAAPASGREPLHIIAKREGAVAAINGDFFDFTANSLGLAIQDGELLSETMDYRVCLGIQEQSIVMDVLSTSGLLTVADRHGFAVRGINRLPDQGEIVILTPRFARSLPVKKPGIVIRVDNVELPLRVSKEMIGKIGVITPFESGESLPPCPSESVEIVAFGETGKSLGAAANRDDKVTVRFDLFATPMDGGRGQYASRSQRLGGAQFVPKWDKIEQAIGGGPWLLRDGNLAVDIVEQRFTEGTKFASTHHPRSAAGVTKDGTLLLVTVDGRQAWSGGISLDELAKLMKRLGAVNAINLDGGGSTSMIVHGGVVNAPSDGRLRPVPNGLLIFAPIIETPPDETLQIKPVSNDPKDFTIPISAKQTFQVLNGEGKRVETPIIWGTEDGLGLITQSGTFLSYKPGKVRLFARVGSQQLSATVTVVKETPAAENAPPSTSPR